ncbi:MAG: methyltransferase domain-containing protein [Acidobacteriota bacterium]
MKDVWNPEQYEKFKTERLQPFYDLLALVRPRVDMRVADLGCGTGEPTSILHEQLQARETIGFDNSDAMLAKAKLLEGNGLRFEKCDIENFAAESERSVAYGQFDLIFSNAALHWAQNHQTLIRQLMCALSDGGQFAAQIPSNHHHPSHVVANRVASEIPFREALDGYIREEFILTPEEYATLFHRSGFRDYLVRSQIYVHPLESRESVVDWVKSTRLTDYQKRLSEEMYALYLERYKECLMEELEDEHPFLYTYNRILLWARK